MTSYDIGIIGGGPAGCSAALYASRAGYSTVLFTGCLAGGQLLTTSTVENYLGLDRTDGYVMVTKFLEHAAGYGATVVTQEVVKVDKQNEDKPGFRLVDSKGDQYQVGKLIVATGATAKRLHLPQEHLFWNKGISACAVCDGALPLFRNKVVAVVGGGDSACEEAMFLTAFAKQVILIHRGADLRASHIMQQRVKTSPKITLLYHTQVVDVEGKETLSALQLRHNNNNTESRLEVAGLFYAIGHTPDSSVVKHLVDIDAAGYIKTVPGSTRTSYPGIYAAGDVQDKIYRQAITSAGTGCMAALDAAHDFTHA